HRPAVGRKADPQDISTHPHMGVRRRLRTPFLFILFPFPTTTQSRLEPPACCRCSVFKLKGCVTVKSRIIFVSLCALALLPTGCAGLQPQEANALEEHRMPTELAEPQSLTQTVE